MLRWFTLCAAALLSISTTLKAATIEAVPTDDNAAVIVISGRINLGDAQRFAEVSGPFQRAAVVLRSPGGNLHDGLRIGQMIRARGFDTGVMSGRQNLCASACALIWLGGERRLMERGAMLGFHAPYRVTTGGEEMSSVGSALMGHYLGQMGISARAVQFMSEPQPNEELAWLSVEDAAEFGIAVTVLAGPAAAPARPAVRPYAPTPEIASRTMEQAATEFAARLHVVFSDQNPITMRFLSRAYADNVVFYGGPQTSARILALKQRFLERWPQRLYTVRQESIRVSCDQVQRTCSVSGILDWDARSSARNARSTGAANFSFVLAMQRAGVDPIIIAENGSVISRRLDP